MNLTRGNNVNQQSLFSSIDRRESGEGTFVARTGGGGNIRGNSFQTMGTGRDTARATGRTTATGTATGTARATGNRQYTSPNSPSPKKTGSRMEKDRYIAALELEMEELKERCMLYGQTVKELRYEKNKLEAKTHNKKDLRNKFGWNGNDATYSDTVINFCKVWLFPRYKFLHGDWMMFSEDRKSLSSLVLRHCAVPLGVDREDAWDRVVAPTIAKKYADMRCNINNDIRKALMSK
jgi:hypothetical protein